MRESQQSAEARTGEIGENVQNKFSVPSTKKEIYKDGITLISLINLVGFLSFLPVSSINEILKIRPKIISIPAPH